MTTAERSSRWSRRFVLTGAAFFVAWQIAVVTGESGETGIFLGLFGFVFHTIFGKTYSLLPTYFDRDLVTTRTMPLHFGAVFMGTVLLVVGSVLSRDTPTTIGAIAWAVGVAVFLGTLLFTIRDNLSGAETATSESNEVRKRTDRLANLFMPLALGYLAAGTYELLAIQTGLPSLFDGYRPRMTHLLAAGAGTLLVFSIGFRLLPRFLVARPPTVLVVITLTTGALAPAILAATLPGGPWFRLGAGLQAVAMAGFALAFWILYYRSDRRRVGFYGILACSLAGLAGVGLGVQFALVGVDVDLLVAHRRANVLGFLGLAIIGVSYQFYPPSIGSFPLASDRTALGVILLVFGGLLLEILGSAGLHPSLLFVGRALGAVGAVLHLYLLVGLFRERYG